MRIRVKGYFNFKEVLGNGGDLAICLEDPTVWRVLELLVEMYGARFRDQVLDAGSGRLKSQVQILINGRHIRYFPQKLNTRLEENDFIALFPAVAGG